MTDTRLLLCNCQKTMHLDGDAIAKALGADAAIPIHTELCGAQISTAADALKAGGPLRIACTQEAALFAELADEHAADAPAFVNIRERSGWSEAGDAVTPKTAALLAAAAYPAKPAGLTTLTSEGVCLVIGAGQNAFDTAMKLSSRMSVSLLLTDARDIVLPSNIPFQVATGRIRSAKGHLGGFGIDVDGYAQLIPSSRAEPQFTLARDGAASTCDIILDLTNAPPLFTGHAKRDGYLRADPASPGAVAEAMFAASDLIGEFEKPLYVSDDAAICAHARSGKIGCRNCLDVCPTGAIAPAEEHVEIAAEICAGCGSCHAVCPTGAVSYAYPERPDLLAQMQIALGVYRGAGGRTPVLLFHDTEEGEALINAIARFGRGLPANVLPFPLHATSQLGHDVLLALIASGAQHVVLHLSQKNEEERPVLEGQIGLAAAFLEAMGHASGRLHLADQADPDAFETLLYGLADLPDVTPGAFATSGTKRDTVRLALAHLSGAAETAPETFALPKGAPYGRINVNTSGCTLCLSCVSACPTGAITDDADRPQIAFTEQACVQCGICAATCPEGVIALEPRYTFSTDAMAPTVIKTEQPASCVRCGKDFGTQSTINAVLERLKGHSMFAREDQMRLIQMCDDCRVITVAEGDDNPFGGGGRPRIRTTDDDLAEAASAPSAKPKTPDDFLS
ncbi:MAG: 4Fe-4S dicluster domain-containing protein [Pseudomonadota bacterium]